MRPRTVTPLELSFPCSCGITVVHITFMYVTNSIILVTVMTLLSFVCFREAGRRNESNCIFIAFVILACLFCISNFCHLFLWIQVTTWSHFLSPRQICSHLFCAIIGQCTTVLYIIGQIIQLYTYYLINCFLNQLRKEKRSIHLYCVSQLHNHLIGAPCFFMCICIVLWSPVHLSLLLQTNAAGLWSPDEQRPAPSQPHASHCMGMCTCSGAVAQCHICAQDTQSVGQVGPSTHYNLPVSPSWAPTMCLACAR